MILHMSGNEYSPCFSKAFVFSSCLSISLLSINIPFSNSPCESPSVVITASVLVMERLLVRVLADREWTFRHSSSTQVCQAESCACCKLGMCAKGLPWKVPWGSNTQTDDRSDSSRIGQRLHGLTLPHVFRLKYKMVGQWFRYKQQCEFHSLGSDFLVVFTVISSAQSIITCPPGPKPYGQQFAFCEWLLCFLAVCNLCVHGSGISHQLTEQGQQP